MKQSAGTLLYRRSAAGVEVLIVKPSGPAARYGWSIPKGLPEPDETLEEAARRETREETGVDAGDLRELGYIDYVKSKKRVTAFFGEAAATSTPRKTSWEVSEARFVPVENARTLLHADQRAFIEMLVTRLAQQS